jgi:hypothetical protein
LSSPTLCRIAAFTVLPSLGDLLEEQRTLRAGVDGFPGPGELVTLRPFDVDVELLVVVELEDLGVDPDAYAVGLALAVVHDDPQVAHATK